MPTAFGQGCGTDLTEEQESAIQAEQPKMRGFEISKMRGERTFAVQVHIVTRSDGTGGYRKENLKTAFSRLNQYFTKANVRLIPNSQIKYIKSDKYYEFQKEQEDSGLGSRDLPNMINLYIVNTISSGGGYANLCGYAYMPNGYTYGNIDRLVMDRKCMDNGMTLIHEFGHYFGLLHTHGSSNTYRTQELVNGNNCRDEGDGLCDTPADPKLSYNNVNSNCQYVGNARDANGQTYRPMVNNYMSYAPSKCCNKFTNQQYQAVGYTATNLRSYLKKANVIPTNTTTTPTNPVVSAETYFERGLKASDQNDKIRLYTKAIELDPGMAPAYNNRAWAKYKLGRYQSALLDANQSIRLDKDKDAYHTRGSIYMGLKKYQLAINDFNKALAIDPNLEEAKLDKRKAEAKLKELQTALSASDYFQMARKTNDFREKVRLYSKVIQLKPNHAAAYNNRGWAKYKLGSYEEGIKDATKSLSLERNEYTYHTRGACYMNLGRYKEAIGDFDRALAIAPDFEDAREDKERAQEKLNNQSQLTAKDYFEMALNTSNLYTKVRLYTKALKLDPNYAAAYNNRGWSKYLLGRYGEAINDANKALALERDPNTYHTRGAAYMGLGQYNKAIADFNRALEIDPGFQDALTDKKKAQDKLRQTSASQNEGHNYLLVIGINAYEEWNTLDNAVSDARSVKQELSSRYQFDSPYTKVLYDADATKEKIREAFVELIGKIQSNDNLMIYFAGHGYYDDVLEEGYWIPVDARVNQPTTYLSNSDLLTFVKRLGTKHTFIVADACFSGSLLDEKRRGDLASNVEKFRSRRALVSGRLELVSDDSPFVEAFLTYLRTNQEPAFPSSELEQYVKRIVARNSSQTPRNGALRNVGDMGGEFVFKLR